MCILLVFSLREVQCKELVHAAGGGDAPELRGQGGRLALCVAQFVVYLLLWTESYHPLNPRADTLTPHVVVLGDGAFGR